MINTTISQDSNAGNGSTTAFTFSFSINAITEVQGMIIDSSSVVTLLTVDVDYSVTSINANDFIIKYPISGSALASGSTIKFIRSTDKLQSTDYNALIDSFNPETIESSIDKLTKIVQDLQTQVNKSFRLPDQDTTLDVLGNSNSIKNKYPSMNSTGTAVQFLSTVPSSEVITWTNYKLASTDTLANHLTAIGSDNYILVMDSSLDGAGQTIPANVTILYLHKDGKFTGTGTLTINGTFANDPTWPIFASTLTISGLGLISYIRPEWWGAVGDGSTNDKTPLKSCASSMPVAGGKIVFRPVTYMVDTATAFTIFFNLKTNFILEGNNCTIKVVNSDPVVANGVIMYFQDCSDGVVKNFKLDGNRANRTPAITTAHLCYLRNSCSDVTFHNVHTLNGVTDGFYLDSTTPGTPSTVPTDIAFFNCVAFNCYRNGMSSINSIRLLVDGGAYHGNNGNNPEAGIDLEDDGTSGNVDPIIRNVQFYDNTGEGLQLSGSVGCTNAKISNCWFKNNTSSAITVGLIDGLTMHDINIAAHTGAATRGIVDLISSTSKDITIKNITFHDCNPTGSSKYALYVHGSVAGPVDIDGINIYDYNCAGISINTANSRVSNAHIENGSGGSTDYPFIITGDRGTVTNMFIENSPAKILIGSDAADFTLDGLKYINCSDTLYIWANVADIIFRNITIIDTLEDKSSGTDKCITLSSTVKELSNINIDATLGQYPADRAFDFSAGAGNTAILSNLSPGFFTKMAISADNGDAAATLTMGLSESIQIWDSAITADRAVTLSTTDAIEGNEFTIVRTANATGAFNLNVGTGPLKAMGTAGSYSVVKFNGTAWILTQYGTL